VFQFAIRAGSAIFFFRPWAPKAPRVTEEAPYMQPSVQKGRGIVLLWCSIEVRIENELGHVGDVSVKAEVMTNRVLFASLPLNPFSSRLN
jgi:hypothetical protein